jgi:hypothetical protein
VCTPSASTTSWSNATGSIACDDGNACTKNDVCASGTCVGTAYACAPSSCQASSACDGAGGCTAVNKSVGSSCPDDGNPCTMDVCDGSGACTHTSAPDGTGCGSGLLCRTGGCVAQCDIGGVFYSSGAMNPVNVCNVCTPGSSTTNWSNVPDGTSCGGGYCSAGVCH